MVAFSPLVTSLGFLSSPPLTASLAAAFFSLFFNLFKSFLLNFYSP